VTEIRGAPPPEDPPTIEEHPDTAPAALQALRGDSLYFNVAGSGPTFPVAQRAAERFRNWLNEVGMFGHVGYAAYNAALDATRADLAAALGDPGGAARVALAQSATDGLNTLVAGLAIPARSLIVTTLEEHGSALYPLRRRAELGDELREIAWHQDPDRFLDEIRAGMRDGARALVISLVSCKTGDVLPVREACRIARDAGAISIVDAAQALGQVRVDVNELGADAVVTLGHKWLHGPLATGGLWVRDHAQFTPTRVGWRSRLELPTGSHEYNPNATRFEAGTVDAAAFVGLRQTLVVHNLLGPWVSERLRDLRRRLLERIADLPVIVRSTPEAPTGIVVVEPRGGDVAALVQRMWDEERIVVKLIDEPGMPQAIRLSFWALHKERDIDRLAAAFARTLAVGVR
jgi:cysteine desulfurase/selenocysteine lyase